MSLLYFWRRDNYYRDLDLGAGYNLNQANPLMHQIDQGDSLWAFTRNRDGRYVLAAELVCKAKTENPPNFRYGRYRLWGDINLSRYFKVDEQPGFEQIIRNLSIPIQSRILGHSFQGHAAVKKISTEDHLILATYSANLAIEPRARILPEERLEASLLLGDKYAVEQLVQEESAGIAEVRQQYLYQHAPARNSHLSQQLQEMYSGRCQVCLWHPRNQYGHDLCQAHHLVWMSRGGEDDISNMVLICPNHHAAIHRADAPLDFSEKSFNFGSHNEAIQLNYHLEFR